MPTTAYSEPVPRVHILGNHLSSEPFPELLLIGDRDRAEPEKCSNLFTIVLAAATLQVIVEPGSGGNRQLLPNKRQDWGRDILVVWRREPSVDLKELQQDRPRRG